MTAEPTREPVADTGPLPIYLDGRYVVRQVLSRGETTTVYLATDTTLGRVVVVKALHAPLLAVPAIIERFLAIQRRLAALTHPHLVTLFDARATDDACFAVMEHLPGGTLADRLAARRPLPPEVLAMGAQLASALHYLHDAGLAHGQLAAHHVLVDASGAVKLIDVGGPLAVPVAETPEVATVARPPSADADVAALAALLYEALMGHRPVAPSPSATEFEATLVAARPDLPPGLAHLLARCLAPEAGAWPVTAAEAERALWQMIQAAAGVGAPGPDADTRAIRHLPMPEPATATLGPTPRPRARGFSAPRRLAGLPVAVGALGRRVGRHLGRHLIAPAITALVGLVILGSIVGRLLNPPLVIPAPTLTGQSLDTALALAARDGLGLIATNEYSATVAAGLVIRQAPPPGARLATDQPIIVAVSRGPAAAVAPDLRQRRLEEARADLVAAGLVLGRVIERETPRQPWGIVLEQALPAGVALPRDALVDVTVAVPPWTAVPSLLDRPLGEVEQDLERQGLRLGPVSLQATTGKRAGTVVAQEPAPGLRARQGERVAVTIAVPPP